MNIIPDDIDLHNAPKEGFYSESEYYWTIRQETEWEYDPNREWLCLGGPGVDGIEFGIRRGFAGVFAYYPIEDRYELKAESVPDLIEGWCEGRIKV